MKSSTGVSLKSFENKETDFNLKSLVSFMSNMNNDETVLQFLIDDILASLQLIRDLDQNSSQLGLSPPSYQIFYFSNF